MTYTLGWRSGAIQRKIKEAAGHCCEECGIAFHADSNLAVSAVNKKGNPIVGTVHHINQIKSDNRWENLAYLCQSCHVRAHAWLPGKPLPSFWDQPPSWIVRRGLSYSGFQMRLWEES